MKEYVYILVHYNSWGAVDEYKLLNKHKSNRKLNQIEDFKKRLDKPYCEILKYEGYSMGDCWKIVCKYYFDNNESFWLPSYMSIIQISKEPIKLFGKE